MFLVLMVLIIVMRDLYLGIIFECQTRLQKKVEREEDDKGTGFNVV